MSDLNKKKLENLIKESNKTKTDLNKDLGNIKTAINIISNCLLNGGKILLCGNGGSAADAQHLAAEFLVRLKPNVNRKPIPAISLATDTSTLTAMGNDYSFEKIFSRQCESLVNKGDVVVGISTSGNSINVKNGLLVSKRKGAKTVGFLGHKGGHIKNIVDIPLIVNSNSTPRIQEVHRTTAHIICEMVEKNISRRSR